MKNLLFLIFRILPLIVILMFQNAFAQNYLSAPESICYNQSTKKYYVSSLNNGNVVEIDTNNNQTLILTEQTQCAGNTIYNNILYFSSVNHVKGYDITVTPPLMVMNIFIPEAGFLDGMTLDSSGNLYVCDNHYPAASVLYKINLAAQTYWAFVPAGHGIPLSLQDALFDYANNRLIIASYANANSIQMVKLSDSTVTTISSQVKGIDGIARDNEGNYYFTSWQTYALHKFDSSFSGNPVIIASNLNGPSQPCYNPDKNLIAVPLFNGNQIQYIQLTPYGIKIESQLANDYSLEQNYPNPFNGATKINFSVPGSAAVTIDIYDALGRQVAIFSNSNLRGGSYSIEFQASDLSSGIYFYRLTSGKFSETRKMILSK